MIEYLLAMMFPIMGCLILWIIYGYPVRAMIKELENENLRLRIKLKELERWKE